MDLHKEKYKALETGKTYIPPQLLNSQIKSEEETKKEVESKPQMETFEIDESNLRKATENIDITTNQSSNPNPSSSGLDSLNAIYQSVINNKAVSIIINPFQDDSPAIQLCYKIYSGITCFTILLVILLLMSYS